MSNQVVNYQCPACTGPLQYAGGSGKLECEYCGSSFDVEQIETLYAKKEEFAIEEAADAQAAAETEKQQWTEAYSNSDWGEEAAGMKAYNCPSCGAKLVCDETTGATSCPYCGNPSIVPGQFSGTLRPDYVLPFKLNKQAAMDALKAFYKGKMFLPKEFNTQQQLEKIQGVYVPFWLFDASASGSCTYDATRIHTRSTQKENITVTKHYKLYRSGSMVFEKVPVDGSTKMPDAHMDAIEPFDYSQLKPFSTAYLPGFLADQYDVSMQDSQERVELRCKNTLEDALTATTSMYNTRIADHKRLSLTRGSVHYALLPVWLLHVKWNGNGYLFAVNGQTGKLVGDLPIDKKKVIATFTAITGVLGAIGSLLVQMFL